MVFGKSGRSREVHNSVTTTLLDEDGHAFKIRTRPNATSKMLKAKAHRKSQKGKRRLIQWSKDDLIRTAFSVNTSLESMKLIKVQANFVGDCD